MKNELPPTTPAHTALSASGFTALLNAAVDGMVIIDDQGQVVNFNRAAEKMFGYRAEDVVGHNVKMLMPAPYNMEHDGYLSQYRQTGEARVIGIGRNVQAKRSDAKVFPANLAVGEYVVGSERFFIGIIRDLSDQVRAEREAIKARQHLAQVDRINIMGEMASGIAHELNQPLTAISSYVQAGRRRAESDEPDIEKIKELLGKSDEQAQRAGKIIRRIRALVQSHDRIDQVQDIDALVAEAVNFALIDAGQRGIKIELNLADGNHLIAADSVQIQQVLLNLIRNGVDAYENSDSGINTIDVESRVIENSERIQVCVRDRGDGIDDAVKENLFETFITTKKHGTGMGLSISRSIVQAHGGEIWFENAFPGTRFCFTLPLTQGTASAE